MSVKIGNIKNLLSSARRIAKHQEDLKRLRGENFNVFSILKMERKENGTHSAFINELLNPQGSHLLGNVFLKLFLETIKYPFLEEFDIESACTKVEHHIAQRDDELRTGGRIDIFIKDKYNRTISIENKIDAIDQDYQIERYANFNQEKNTVYYLTKFGLPPSDISKGDKVENRDYFCLSYEKNILKWLSKCQKAAVDLPILRETIKQYAVLIKKLTFTMDEEQERELNIEILRHIEEAEIISNRFRGLQEQISESFRADLVANLALKLKGKYDVMPELKIASTNSKIWIDPILEKKSKTYFGIESFSGLGHFNGNLFIGLFREEGNLDKSKYADLGFSEFSQWWLNHEEFESFEGTNINMKNSELLVKLYQDLPFRKRLLDWMTDKVSDFIARHEDFVFKNLE